MAVNRTSKARGKILDIPSRPTIGTATGGPANASVAFTPATVGGPAFSYTALSNPGSFTGTGTTSPITVSGLTAGTSYTFTVRGTNASGDSEYTSASNSVVPTVPTSFESISTVTVGSGGASSVEFTSIPNTYTHLQIRYFATKTANGSLYLTYNGVTTGGLYTRHSIYGDGGTLAADFPGTGGNSVDVQCGNTAGNFGAGIIDILDYTNTNKTKVLRTFTGRDNNGSGLAWYTSGFFNSTNAITSIKFTPDSTNLAQYSHFALYGIKVVA